MSAEAAGPSYQEDLAYIHHQGYDEVARGAADLLLARLAEAGISAGPVVDLGCAGGHLLREVSAAGYRAIGVEPSPAFLALAREIAPTAELHQATAQDFELPACAAVTAIGEVLSYLPPDRREPPPLTETCRRIYRALAPGGLFLCDLIVAEGDQSLTARGWRSGADWAVLVDIQEDPARTRLSREIIAFRERPGGYRRSRETHRQQIVRRDALAADLAALGFQVETAQAYGTVPLAPRRSAFLCRKPGVA